MNNTILKKCLTELAKETPDISYVRGMIESLVEMNEPAAVIAVADMRGKMVPLEIPMPGPATGATDEGSLLDAAAAAKLAKVKEIAQKSVSQ